MFCCLLSSRTSPIRKTQNDEGRCLLSSGTTIHYSTVFPYAHAIKDDIIQVESSDVVDTNDTDILLFNGAMPDRTTRSLSFADHNTNRVILATTTNNDPCLLERLFSINHASAINSSTNSMSSIKSPTTNSSNAVPKARPFDEFCSDITSGNPFDGKDFGTTKSDKD